MDFKQGVTCDYTWVLIGKSMYLWPLFPRYHYFLLVGYSSRDTTEAQGSVIPPPKHICSRNQSLPWYCDEIDRSKYVVDWTKLTITSALNRTNISLTGNSRHNIAITSEIHENQPCYNYPYKLHIRHWPQHISFKNHVRQAPGSRLPLLIRRRSSFKRYW